MMPMSHVTTTIRLPRELHEQLRRRAFERRVSLAELVRGAVQEMLARPPGTGAALPALEDDPFWSVVGSVEGGPSDEAFQHDHYLYGTPKKT